MLSVGLRLQHLKKCWINIFRHKKYCIKLLDFLNEVSWIQDKIKIIGLKECWIRIVALRRECWIKTIERKNVCWIKIDKVKQNVG